MPEPGLTLGPLIPLSPAAAAMRAAALPSESSEFIFPTLPRAVINQGPDVPCCVSCALAAAMEMLHPLWPPLAPLFHYFITRFERGGADPRGFLQPLPALRVLESLGISKLELHHPPF